MSTSPRRLGKYELREHLGRGGMAEVWKALDTQLGRYVAIKVLHPDLQSDPNFVSRFEREARVIASLHHPNIIQIYDFHVTHPPETETTVAYMVMDYVEGTTLAHYMRHTAHIGIFPSPTQLLQLFASISTAVDYAHQQGMIHRDLKPSNILLDKRGTAKTDIGVPILSDFGIAKLLGSSNNSLSGGWLGTPSYISPEQVQGSPGTEKSDIYSLSVILYEMCTGMLPFQGETPMAIMMQHVNAMPTSPGLINKNIPPTLSAVIMRGLAKSPDARFSSASALVAAMADALGAAVPENTRPTAFMIDTMNSPTYITARPNLPPNPSPTPLPVSLATPAMDQTQARPNSWQAFSNRPAGATPLPTPPQNVTPSPVYATPVLAATAPQGEPPVPPSHPSRNSPMRQRILLSILLVLLLIGGSVAALFVLIPRHTTSIPTPPQNPIVGYAFFLSSGLLDPNNSKGINDELLVELHNIAPPPAGQAYFGWLLSDKSQTEPLTIPLDQLTINHGNINLLYKGNTQHSNLLVTESRFLITAEDASNTPAIYTPNLKAWLYYAEISQAPSPKDKLHFTMLDHLRHLTSDSPELTVRGLRGGLDMWLLRNTQKVLEWANAARDDWNKDPDFLHRQIVRILDYIDGSVNVQKDAPSVGAVVLADQHDAQVPLLGPAPDGQDPPGYSFDDEPAPGYVYLVSSHLAGAVLSPDATSDQRNLANQIHSEIDRVKAWLEGVHQDAKQLITMNATQLNQSSTLAILDDMVTLAQYAYTGQTDPSTGQTSGGVIWISGNVQRMASFAVKPYHS